MSLVDDATLLKMAEAEILGEAKRAVIRHSVAGVSGWQPSPKLNKVFLTNIVLRTMASNRYITKLKSRNKEKDIKHKRTERKLLQKSGKTDMTANFIYQKPMKSKKKPVLSTKNSKCNNIKTRSDNGHCKNEKQIKEKCKRKKLNSKIV